jgi:dipeptidyl aminopeptidase/acylaminoacyl peptidase
MCCSATARADADETLHAHASLPRLIPRQLLFGPPEKFSPHISPDGTMFAYQRPDAKSVMNIWLKNIGKDDDRMITNARKGELDGPTWQWDNKHILYSQDNDGDENFHIYQTDINIKLTRDLTPFLGARANILAMEPKYPNTLLATINIRDSKFDDVYRIDTSSGAVDLDTVNTGDVSSWAVDDDLNVRAATAKTKEGKTEIRVRNSVSDPWRTIMTWGPEENGSIMGFTPDNHQLLIKTSVNANTARLISLDIATNKQTVLAEDPKYDADAVALDPSTHELEAVSFVREKREWQPLSESVKVDYDELKKIDGEFTLGTRDLKNRKWIVCVSSDITPSTYYLYDRDKKSTELLYCSRPNLGQYQFSKMQPIAVTARDGLVLHGYLVLPAGVEPKNLPTVLSVHGGPWVRSAYGFYGNAQWLANRGYAVIMINYRGSTGYGKKFMNAGDHEWANKMQEDLIDTKRWAVDKGYTDPKRVCIQGHSYGGYAALVGATFTPEEFKCAIDSSGPANLVTLLKSMPAYWEAERALIYRRVGNPVTEKEFLESRSPVFKAQNITIPVLIAQGANDVRVKKAEADQIVSAMRKNKKEVVYMVFPKMGHGFARNEDYLKFNARVEEFLAQHLGGRAEPPTEAEKSDDLLQ